MKLPEFVRFLLTGNQSRQQPAILLARISLGMFFGISGADKLFVPSRAHAMFETLVRAGIPFPDFMTYFVSSVEFICGCLLVVGLLSSLSCAALIVDMIIAISTVQLGTIPAGRSFLDWLDDFLYLPEPLYVILLIWLICSGPGKVSIDARLARALS